MLLDVLGGFIQELRQAGIPVSMVETIDAMEALRHTDLSDREMFKAALGATLVKNERHYDAFDTAFEVFFALQRPAPGSEDGEADRERTDAMDTAPQAGFGRGGTGGEADLEGIIAALKQALAEHSLPMLRAVARRAVEQLAGMEAGRPVGGTYYLYRTLRQLDVDGLLESLIEEAKGQAGRLTELEDRLLREEYEERLQQLRDEIKAEIRRRLVADRGREAVAKTLRKPLLEDTDLMHATRADLVELEAVIHPLTRKMAARLAQQRRRRRAGRLDFRRTMRRSLSTGGVPLEPQFRAPARENPKCFYSVTSRVRWPLLRASPSSSSTP